MAPSGACNSPTGKLIWSYDSIRNFVECKPLVLKKSVVFGSWGNTFYSLDKKSGQLNWKREKYANRMLSPAAVWPVAARGKIFLVAPDRHMTALEELTGKEIWDSGKYSCRESIGISSDGTEVYIKNMTEGNVDAFDTSSGEQKLTWECKAGLGYEIAPSPIVRVTPLYICTYFCRSCGSHRQENPFGGLETQGFECFDQRGASCNQKQNPGKFDGWKSYLPESQIKG